MALPCIFCSRPIEEWQAHSEIQTARKKFFTQGRWELEGERFYKHDIDADCTYERKKEVLIKRTVEKFDINRTGMYPEEWKK